MAHPLCRASVAALWRFFKRNFYGHETAARLCTHRRCTHGAHAIIAMPCRCAHGHPQHSLAMMWAPLGGRGRTFNFPAGGWLRVTACMTEEPQLQLLQHCHGHRQTETVLTAESITRLQLA